MIPIGILNGVGGCPEAVPAAAEMVFFKYYVVDAADGWTGGPVWMKISTDEDVGPSSW